MASVVCCLLALAVLGLTVRGQGSGGRAVGGLTNPRTRKKAYFIFFQRWARNFAFADTIK